MFDICRDKSSSISSISLEQDFFPHRPNVAARKPLAKNKSGIIEAGHDNGLPLATTTGRRATTFSPTATARKNTGAPGACTIKHYESVIYGKLTNFVVS
jgi:hypothetical protein